MSVFPDLVRKELTRAKEHAPINSAHEGYAVLLEEVEEFWREVQMKRADRDPQRLLAELVQVGAVAQRVAEDLGLTE